MNAANISDTAWHGDKKKTLFSTKVPISEPLNSPTEPAACLLVMYHPRRRWMQMLITS